MKKFIAGLAIGHILTNALYLYLDGGVDRVKFILEYLKEHPGEAPPFTTMVEYLMVGDDPADSSVPVDPAVKAWVIRIKRIRAMSAEGYSSAEIADSVGIPTAFVIEIVDSEVKPCP